MKQIIALIFASLILGGCSTLPKTDQTPEELPLEVSDGLPTNDAAGGTMLAGTPLPEDAPTVEFVKAALAAKYPAGEMDAAEIEVVEETETHFSGVVKPVDDLNGSTGGGYVFATKTETGNWIIVADGQGSINCDDANLYEFPTSMIAECLDENTGEIIQR